MTTDHGLAFYSIPLDGVVEPAKETNAGCAQFSFSGIIRNLRQFAENGPEAWDIQGTGNAKFQLPAANTPELRERVFRLGAKVYKKMGYMIVQTCDFREKKSKAMFATKTPMARRTTSTASGKISFFKLADAVLALWPMTGRRSVRRIRRTFFHTRQALRIFGGQEQKGKTK